MMVIVTYDIAAQDAAGKKRLRKIAKKCGDWGIHVQASVYECKVNAEQYIRLKQELQKLMNCETDSIRFYLLGNRYWNKMETLGKQKCSWDWESFVI